MTYVLINNIRYLLLLRSNNFLKFTLLFVALSHSYRRRSVCVQFLIFFKFLFFFSFIFRNWFDNVFVLKISCLNFCLFDSHVFFTFRMCFIVFSVCVVISRSLTIWQKGIKTTQLWRQQDHQIRSQHHVQVGFFAGYVIII